jgi:hypothetical protein
MTPRDSLLDDLTAAIDRAAGLNPEASEWDIQAALRWLSSRWRRPARLDVVVAATYTHAEPPALKKFRREAASDARRITALATTEGTP